MVGVDPAGRPLISYLTWNAASAGYTQVVLLLGARNAALRTYIEERSAAGEFPGIRWTFATQPIPEGRTKPLGTADALDHALRAVPAWSGTCVHGLQRRQSVFTTCVPSHGGMRMPACAHRLRPLGTAVRRGADPQFRRARQGCLRISAQAIIEKPGESELARAREASRPHWREHEHLPVHLRCDPSCARAAPAASGARGEGTPGGGCGIPPCRSSCRAGDPALPSMCRT